MNIDRITQNDLETERYILSTKPVLYLPLYKLDGAFFASRDAYGHLCTVTGATWGLQGRTFDGTGVNSNIACGTADGALNITGNQITIIAWEKDTKVISKGWIISKMGAGAGSWGLSINPPHTIRRMAMSLDTGAWSDYYSSNNFVPADIWNCVAGTYDGAKIKFYCNGIKDATEQSLTGNLISHANTTKIGWEDGWNSQNYSGILGEIWVYTRALSLAEIQHIYLATKWRYQ